MSYLNTPDTLLADTNRYYRQLEEQDAYDAEIERIIEEIRPGFLDNHTLTIHHYKGEWAVNLWRVEDGQLEEEIAIEVLKHTIADAAKRGSQMIDDELYRLAKNQLEEQIKNQVWEGWDEY
jgi:hypothetical protein